MSDLSNGPSPDYFGHSRREIEPLLPSSALRILEIGCSAGGTIAWLKTKWPNAEFVGVDGNPAVLDELQKSADRTLIHDLEEPIPEIGSFDLILALDVLEHLRQPSDVLKDLVSRLNKTGRIIVSIPNLAHVSVIADLALRRRFEYHGEGILDRTHLRFFTESSAVQLMTGAGLTVIDGIVNGLEGRKSAALNRLTAGAFFHYFVKQYIMAGVPGEGISSFKWRRHGGELRRGG
jgi:2-polyprenyl-3-methyl-5-hydroxy-6-metoxy-1,4-benzoquinol methylase